MDLVATIPVNQHTIDSGVEHQQQVVLQDVGISRIIRSNEWIEVRGHLPPLGALGASHKMLRVLCLHLPMVAPKATEIFALEPGHVVHVDPWFTISPGDFPIKGQPANCPWNEVAVVDTPFIKRVMVGEIQWKMHHLYSCIIIDDFPINTSIYHQSVYR